MMVFSLVEMFIKLSMVSKPVKYLLIPPLLKEIKDL